MLQSSRRNSRTCRCALIYFRVVTQAQLGYFLQQNLQPMRFNVICKCILVKGKHYYFNGNRTRNHHDVYLCRQHTFAEVSYLFANLTIRILVCILKRGEQRCRWQSLPHSEVIGKDLNRTNANNNTSSTTAYPQEFNLFFSLPTIY